MKLLKRILFASSALAHSSVIGWLSAILALFYFGVAEDMFWAGNTNWASPAMVIVLHAPIFIYVAAAILIFVYNFMKKKVEQANEEIAKLQQASMPAEAEATEPKDESNDESTVVIEPEK